MAGQEGKWKVRSGRGGGPAVCLECLEDTGDSQWNREGERTGRSVGVLVLRAGAILLRRAIPLWGFSGERGVDGGVLIEQVIVLLVLEGGPAAAGHSGDDGEEHGEFKTKKEADAQRRAMYANGYKG